MVSDDAGCCRSLYNNIRTPGQLQPTATFYLFKVRTGWVQKKYSRCMPWSWSIWRLCACVKLLLEPAWLAAVACMALNHKVQAPVIGQIRAPSLVAWLNSGHPL